MSIAYKDLKPSDATFVMNKKEYELRPFDLTAQVWASEFFATKEQPNGLITLSEKIADFGNFSALYNCIWHLLKRKRDFNHFSSFLSQVEKGDEDKDSTGLTGDMYRAFVKTLGVSQPQLENIQEELELKKQSTAVN